MERLKEFIKSLKKELDKVSWPGRDLVIKATISVIQGMVEHRLLDAGYIKIAEHYISYRLQRDLERNGYGDKVIVHLRFEQKCYLKTPCGSCRTKSGTK